MTERNQYGSKICTEGSVFNVAYQPKGIFVCLVGLLFDMTWEMKGHLSPRATPFLP